MAKRAQLVCQYLENIDRATLEKYQKMIRGYIGRRNGIYALYRRGSLYYVGLATNLRSRLKTHLKDRHGLSWDRFSVYLTIGDAHLKELESLILRITVPSGNRHSGKFSKAENLRKKLARDMKLRFRDEIAQLIGGLMPIENGVSDDEENERPDLAQYVNRRMVLRGVHKRKTSRAIVRSDGTIRFKKKIFMSPSKAARFACGHRINGWWFWKYERAPGDWVRLRELRQR